jgi:hypothetical protein
MAGRALSLECVLLPDALACLRPPAGPGTRFWLDGEQLARALQRRDGRPLLRIEVPPLAQPAWLYWLAPERGRRGRETRSLGLPLREAKLEIALREPGMETHDAHDDLVQPMRRTG